MPEMHKVDVINSDGEVIGEQWLGEAGDARFTFWSCLCGAGTTTGGPMLALDCCHRKGIHTAADVTHGHVAHGLDSLHTMGDGVMRCVCGAGFIREADFIEHTRDAVAKAEARADAARRAATFGPLVLTGELLPTPPTGVTPAVEALALRTIEALLDIEDITAGAILDALIDARVVFTDEVSRLIAALGAKPKWTIAPDSDADKDVMRAWNAYCNRLAEMDKTT